MSLIQTLAVAEHLNFRHAANALGVSLSSLSARVKALEEELGVLLFERHARGVRRTETGRRFVEHVAAGVDHLDHAVKTASMAASGESGRLGTVANRSVTEFGRRLRQAPEVYDVQGQTI